MTRKEWLAAVHEVPCVICTHMGRAQSTATQAHHIESVRDEHSDYAVAALCADCHTGANGVHGLSRRTFSMRYGLSDIDLIARTIAAVAKGMK